MGIHGANCLSVDPKTGYIFMGTEDGVYRSKDKGVSFEKVHSDVTGTYALAIDSSGLVYAGGNGVSVSYNYGESWFEMNNWTDHLSVTAMALNPKGDLYFGDVQGGLYKSFDQAQNFLPLSNEMSITYVPTIVVNSEGAVFIGSLDKGIVRSDDNGAAWKFINAGLTNPEIQTMTIAPDGSIYAGSRNGCLYCSTDNGNTWKQVQLGIAITPVNKLMIDPDGDLYAFSIYNGLFRSNDKGSSWNECVSGLYYVGYFSSAINSSGDLFISASKGFYKSTDKGNSWVCVYNANDYSPFAYMAINAKGDIFGFNRSGELIKSTDDGSHWNLASTNFTSEYVNSFVAAPNGNLFVGVSGAKGVFRSTDSGITWEQKSNGLVGLDNYENITTMTIDSKEQLFVGIAGDRGVYRSTDNGENWMPAKTGFHMGSYCAIASDGKGQVVASGGQEIYRSIDNGDNWTHIITPETNQYVHSIIFDHDGEIFYGTSRGVYKEIDSLTTAVYDKRGTLPVEYLLEQNYPNPFNPSTTISYSIPGNAHVKLVIYDMLGRIAATLVDEYQSASRYSVQWSPSGITSGVYFYRLEAAGEDGNENFVSVKKLLFLK